MLEFGLMVASLQLGEKRESELTIETFMSIDPVFRTETDKDLLEPIFTLLKSSSAFDNSILAACSTSAIPLPLNEMVLLPSSAFEVRLIEDAKFPTAVGENVTLTLCSLPGAMVPLVQFNVMASLLSRSVTVRLAFPVLVITK